MAAWRAACFAVIFSFTHLHPTVEAQVYARLMEENRRSRASAASSQPQVSSQKRGSVGGGWGGGVTGQQQTRQVSASGAVSTPKSTDTWSPPTGLDPYGTATQRFKFAEKLGPFTYLENQALKCPPTYALGSTTADPDLLGETTASCFDFCAARPDCA